ncbi:hypothetical protein [Jiangella alba]|uniref:Uncharacterized protein n=1 Tax=Jiangella alba TaxID=561176 RepID=A0A1H5PY24_9ACTN|nr:hypothetical protein [Jiangella alba]SEF18101.1 hypothetical protein SAMN04488561_6222 [Jiangella alba]
MRNFQMTVVERREPFEHEVQTHPFEAAWASEAIFFVRVEAIPDGTRLDAAVQMSADGIRWVDEGTTFPTMSAAGDYAVKVSHFGGWLRLAGRLQGADPAATLTVQLALKE